MRSSAPAALAALLALAAPSASRPPAPPQGPPPSPVRVDPVRSEVVSDRRLVTGEVRAVRRSIVAVREAGLVAELLVREGERVEAGAVVARLDPALLELEDAVLAAQEAENEALTAERAAAHDRAARDLAILEELSARDAVNPKELSDARTEVELARARRLQAQATGRVLAAQRALLERRRADLAPRAPFGGVVIARHTEAGQWVGVGGAVVEILTSDALEAWLDVPQAYLAALREHHGALDVTLDAGGEELRLDAWRLVPTIDVRARSFSVVVPLPPKAAAADGASLTAYVPNGSEAAHLTVDRDAVLLGDTGAYAFVARGGGEGAPATADLVPLQVLFPAGDRLAVRSPRLGAGDLLVVEGNERLYPGAALLPQPREER